MHPWEDFSGETAAFRFRTLRTVPDSPTPYFRLPDNRRGYDDGLPVEVVTTEGHKWVATFAPGMFSFSRVFAGPGPRHVTVISDGNVYWVPIDRPESALQVRMARWATYVDALDFLVLADWTDLWAIDQEGLLWRSGRLGWDDLNVISVDTDRITGTVFDAASRNDAAPFVVDSRSGQLLGGGCKGFPDWTRHWQRGNQSPL